MTGNTWERLQRLVGMLRVAELQGVADALSLSKKGRKAELQLRVLTYFGLASSSDPAASPSRRREGIVLVIGFLRKHEQHLNVAARFALKELIAAFLPDGRGGGNTGSVKAVPAAHQNVNEGKRVMRCICGSNYEHGAIVQCREPGCGVLQHAGCMGLLTPEAVSKAARDYRCERCRAALADPFWTLAEADLLPPALLRPVPGRPPVVTTQGVQAVQGIERVFYVTGALAELVREQRETHRIVLSCVWLTDEVPCRVHWPRNMDLRCNGVAFRPTTRANNAKMGINARDEAANFSALCSRGRNTVQFAAADGGAWAVLLQHVRRNSREDVKTLMMKRENLADAAARVAKQVSGDDEDLLIESHVVSLRDPMSGVRMACPARFANASGLQAFELDAFLSLAERNRKWQDPITLKNSTVKQLQEDAYMEAVLKAVNGIEDIDDVELLADGKWRPLLSCGNDDQSSFVGPFSVLNDAPETINAAIRAAMGVKRVKLEQPSPSDAERPQGSSRVSDDDDDDGEAELREAAAAVRGLASPSLSSRQNPRESEPEVIDLLDDSSGDEGTLAYATHLASQRNNIAAGSHLSQRQTGSVLSAARSEQPTIGSGIAAGQRNPVTNANIRPPASSHHQPIQVPRYPASSPRSIGEALSSPRQAPTTSTARQGGLHPSMTNGATTSSAAAVGRPPPARTTSAASSSAMQLQQPVPVGGGAGTVNQATASSSSHQAASNHNNGRTVHFGNAAVPGNSTGALVSSSLPPQQTTSSATTSRLQLPRPPSFASNGGGSEAIARVQSMLDIAAAAAGPPAATTSSMGGHPSSSADPAPRFGGLTPQQQLGPLVQPPPGLTWNPAFLQYVSRMQATGHANAAAAAAAAAQAVAATSGSRYAGMLPDQQAPVIAWRPASSEPGIPGVSGSTSNNGLVFASDLVQTSEPRPTLSQTTSTGPGQASNHQRIIEPQGSGSVAGAAPIH